MSQETGSMKAASFRTPPLPVRVRPRRRSSRLADRLLFQADVAAGAAEHESRSAAIQLTVQRRIVLLAKNRDGNVRGNIAAAGVGIVVQSHTRRDVNLE